MKKIFFIPINSDGYYFGEIVGNRNIRMDTVGHFKKELKTQIIRKNFNSKHDERF